MASPILRTITLTGANSVFEDANGGYPVQFRDARRLLVHPDFDDLHASYLYDVGLVLLKRALEFDGIAGDGYPPHKYKLRGKY